MNHTVLEMKLIKIPFSTSDVLSVSKDMSKRSIGNAHLFSICLNLQNSHVDIQHITYQPTSIIIIMTDVMP